MEQVDTLGEKKPTAVEKTTCFQPLAARMRPESIDQFFGQEHLLAEGKPLAKMLQQHRLFSMILWGPPGCGKTTLARLLASHTNAKLDSLSAVLAGVKDIRTTVEKAKLRAETKHQPTILFIDEVHRFNKSQQDALLPHVEAGTITLIGATTENPSFALNNALLSRARVFVLKTLSEEAITKLLQQAIHDPHRGYGQYQISLESDQLQRLVAVANGDARRALNFLEITIELAEQHDQQIIIDKKHIDEALLEKQRYFDKGGDIFYQQISALHKSVRGSSPDAALYWLCRMLDAGCDPLYIARRIVRMASEDIGNADPRALDIALNAWQIQERLGSPEGELALAQAILYLACAAKSNACYVAYNQVMADIQQQPHVDVPEHLCNATTKLQKQMGLGKAYRYAHDEPYAYAAGENYFPESIPAKKYYRPVERGLEIKIKQKLEFLRQLDEKMK